VLRKAQRALGQFRIEGVATNAAFLAALLGHPDVVANRLTRASSRSTRPSWCARRRDRAPGVTIAAVGPAAAVGAVGRSELAARPAPGEARAA